LKAVENTDASLFLSDTAQNCPSNCANTPGCSGFHWDGNSCHLGFGYISSYGAGENENIEFTGRMTSGQFSQLIRFFFKLTIVTRILLTSLAPSS